ncbi:hypothetical protein [Mycobacteroides salmoniphilum]|uniref:hypothetical protein n=1 Tax=Mycobacteroides salmoniphilum TaxID=404941 RepID=UPI001064C8BF|nr:hypothetical protein [Mycobacteroides salmoniphilum]TDZ97843.1 hypothetical protein CCUG62472_00872 [Mycobacteroides salmoniphilum]
MFRKIQTPETDDDHGNAITRAAKVGTLVRAAVQPISSTENADGGSNAESRYRLRLINYPSVLGLSRRSNGEASVTPSRGTP